MTERELIDRFEACHVPSEGFHHRDHVQVVWAYLRTMPVVDALSRFSASLKRFATHHGKSMLYHQTITWAYVALIHERMEQRPDLGWDDFCRLNPDLLTWKPSILDRYYQPGTLDTDLARRVFILPDRR